MILIPIVFNFVGTIVFLTFRPVNTIYKSNIFPFPVVLTLGDARIHIGISNCSNVLTDVKTPVD